MSTNKTNGNQFARETGFKGLSLVKAQLEKRGASVDKEEGPMNLLNVRSADGARVYTIRTKTKGPTSSVWQISSKEGRKPEDPVEENEYWVLVDLPIESEPIYYIIPGTWFRRDIYREHMSYIELHGGERPVTPGSTHHGVNLSRVSEFENRWDLMQL